MLTSGQNMVKMSTRESTQDKIDVHFITGATSATSANGENSASEARKVSAVYADPAVTDIAEAKRSFSAEPTYDLGRPPAWRVPDCDITGGIKTMGYRTITQSAALALAGSTLLAFSITASAGVLTVGQSELAEVEGSVRLRTVIAWPNEIDDTGPIGTSNGGEGQNEASINAIVGDGVDGQTGSGYDGSYSAFARIVGDDSLPELGVFAKTTSPDEDMAFSSGAYARVLQSYVFTGTQAEQFSLSYTLDGKICCDHLDYLSASVLLGKSNYNPEDPFGELTGESTLIDNADLFAAGDSSETNVLVNETAYLNFTLDPGDTIWLDVNMSATAQDELRGDARSSLIDGMHTLAGVFTAGDTTLLSAGLSSSTQATVPAPSALSLLGIGLFGLAASARRRYVRLPA
ncbi:PEP-CTERM sorting domain-containing protein [Lamprobacter modestohalophilus]|uniref:PEP-CTERM sorting domain-containing protein n=1 Tax=Lamprobacter modestohalophilus TaxID=1064514 RepID=UPI0019071E26|nr:PEP-CTERM sorting domain-containing protein [Lamprobacter modestohalophilus]